MPIRLGWSLLLLVQLCGCTSADIAIRKPRNPQADAGEAAPAAPQRAAPVVRAPPSGPRSATPLPATRIPPPAPPAMPPAVVAPPVAVPRASAPITACDAGGCWSAGQRYHGGAGNTYFNRNGRLCQGNGGWMHCF
jgi:hypothetical protein